MNIPSRDMRHNPTGLTLLDKDHPPACSDDRRQSAIMPTACGDYRSTQSAPSGRAAPPVNRPRPTFREPRDSGDVSIDVSNQPPPHHWCRWRFLKRDDRQPGPRDGAHAPPLCDIRHTKARSIGPDLYFRLELAKTHRSGPGADRKGQVVIDDGSTHYLGRDDSNSRGRRNRFSR